ncbi:MAG: zinc ribbon domain-containing protein [Muribaculaceae bacterium]|nr:zinc ribbon domain-containing protein [Muribaculaceae bacterium]
MEQNDFNQQLSNLNNTPDSTGAFNPNDISNNKVMAILAYFGILVLVPLFAAKESPFARFHTNQGLILFIAFIICWILVMVLSAISSWLGLIGTILYIAVGVLAIIGIINAATGKAKQLPLIGGIQLIK